jgi:hypothetical protein
MCEIPWCNPFVQLIYTNKQKERKGMDRFSGRNSEEIVEFNHTINQLDTTDIYKLLHAITIDYIFS